MRATGELGLLAKDHREILQTAVISGQSTTPDGRTGLAIFAGLGIGQVHPAILGKIRRQHHVEQTALALGIHRRHTAQRRGQHALGIQQTQPPGPFSNQQALLCGQKGHAPGVLQTLEHYRHAEHTLLARRLRGLGEQRQWPGDKQ
jgi:hypothetical protein